MRFWLPEAEAALAQVEGRNGLRCRPGTSLDLLQREQRLSYRVLKRRFALDDDDLEDLKEDLIYAKKLTVRSFLLGF